MTVWILIGIDFVSPFLVSFDWEDISNTQDRVSPHFQAPRISSKYSATRFVFSNLFLVSFVLDITLELLDTTCSCREIKSCKIQNPRLGYVLRIEYKFWAISASNISVPDEVLMWKKSFALKVLILQKIFMFAFLLGTKWETWTRREHVVSKTKDCWNKIILARVNLGSEFWHLV